MTDVELYLGPVAPWRDVQTVLDAVECDLGLTFKTATADWTLRQTHWRRCHVTLTETDDDDGVDRTRYPMTLGLAGHDAVELEAGARAFFGSLRETGRYHLVLHLEELGKPPQYWSP